VIRRTVICPDNQEPVTVEMDNKYTFATALQGEEHERLKSCSHWPEKATVDRSAWRKLMQHQKTSSA
jgi:hypothetical protein